MIHICSRKFTFWSLSLRSAIIDPEIRPYAVSTYYLLHLITRTHFHWDSPICVWEKTPSIRKPSFCLEQSSRLKFYLYNHVYNHSFLPILHQIPSIFPEVNLYIMISSIIKWSQTPRRKYLDQILLHWKRNRRVRCMILHLIQNTHNQCDIHRKRLMEDSWEMRHSFPVPWLTLCVNSRTP